MSLLYVQHVTTRAKQLKVKPFNLNQNGEYNQYNIEGMASERS